MSVIKNRIEKNFKRLKSWSEKFKLEAYRIYDKDIPDYPFIVDRYQNEFVIYDRRDAKIDFDLKKSQHFDDLLKALSELFQSDPSHFFIKSRQKQKGLSQYEKLSEEQKTLVIQEGPARFKVNLSDYLDTGLFLDHRILREKVLKLSERKSVLNLFSYTCSISIFAALGKGLVTSVDMSQTYLEWGKENFKLNQINPQDHLFIQENAIEFLSRAEETYDLIICDPPTFSNSKRMADFFEVEKDQEFLIDQCMRILKKDGVFYFSNNKRDFKLLPSINQKYSVRDISKATIPNDFSDTKIHKVFEIRQK